MNCLMTFLLDKQYFSMKKLLLSIFILLLSSVLYSQSLPEPLMPRQMVNDLAGVLNANQKSNLERVLRIYSDTSSTEIAIATVKSLEGYNPNDYAQRLAQKWGIGKKGNDNGILILFKPKSATSKGEIAIAVGYGLEETVPDIIAGRIIRDEMIPYFQRNDTYNGLAAGVITLMRLTSGVFTASDYAKKSSNKYKKSKKGGGLLNFIPFIIFFILPIFLRRRSYTASTRRGGMPFIFFGGGSSSGFDSFSSGSGGFGGFGGGSFGGGGASGSW